MAQKTQPPAHNTLCVRLFIQEHYSGHFTLEAFTHHDLCVFTDDLERGREEMLLLLSDQIERSHPSRQARFAPPQQLAFQVLDLPEMIPLSQPEGRTSLTGKISMFVIQDRQWKQLYFPRFQSTVWVKTQDDLEQQARTFLQEHLIKPMDEHDRLQARHTKREWEESLEIEVQRPTLFDFTGSYLGRELLPTPSEKMAEAEKKSSSSTQNPKKGKKPPTPTLKRLALPISEQAIEHELERCFGREEECEQLFQLITSAGGKAIVVVGPSGSGKTALLHEVAYRLHHEQTPESIRARRIWFADASRLIVDPGLFSNWQSQCLDLLQECIDNDAILYIGDLLHLLDAGKHVHSEQNVSMLLKPYLTRRKLTVVAECTPRHFSQVELRDPSFSRLFRPYRLEDPALPNIEEIMKQVAQDIRKERAISWKLSGQKTILELSQRFQTTPSLLGHCLQFMHRVTEDVAIHTQKSPSQNSSSSRQTGSSTLSPLAISTKESIIERNQVLNSFCRETGMPQFLVRDDIPMHTEEVQRFFLQRLIGQDHAVQSIGDLVSMIKAGFSDPTRPLGSFLFVGPTGVGKTEMAKTLTHFLFGTPQKLIRFDMSEFASPSSVYRFLGDLQEEGKLIREIRQSPFSVLLLDEIEKAHAVIFDVLLQVLGEARITDEQGRTADFRNVVIVMTSNLGVSTFRERPGFSSSAPSDFHQHFMAEAERFFRPEFFNRIDQIIPFTPLPQQAIKKICDKELAKIRKRQGLQQDKRHLELSTSAVAWITEQGVDPRYGARPLKRVLEQQLVTPLAKHLCAQRSPQRHTIQVEHDSTQLRFQNLSEDRNPKTTEVAQ